MKDLATSTCVELPPLVIDNSSSTDPGGGQVNYNYIINFDSEQTVNRQGRVVWKQYIVRVEEKLTYDSIVAALIRAKYSDDEITAILLNYGNPGESEDKRAEHLAEYEVLQTWRSKAKEIARRAYQYAKGQKYITEED